VILVGGGVKVVRICKTCERGQSSTGFQLSLANPPLVSPQGVVHHGADYGITACGKDATGPGWWWRL
jgi:hypothetical protein